MKNQWVMDDFDGALPQGPTRQFSCDGGITSGDHGYMLNHGPGQRSLMSKFYYPCANYITCGHF